MEPWLDTWEISRPERNITSASLNEKPWRTFSEALPCSIIPSLWRHIQESIQTMCEPASPEGTGKPPQPHTKLTGTIWQAGCTCAQETRAIREEQRRWTSPIAQSQDDKSVRPRVTWRKMSHVPATHDQSPASTYDFLTHHRQSFLHSLTGEVSFQQTGLPIPPSLGYLRSLSQGKNSQIFYHWLSLGGGDSLVTQTVKNLPAVPKTQVWTLGWEDPLKKGMATHFSILNLENSMDRGGWQAIVHGVTKNWTRLRD